MAGELANPEDRTLHLRHVVVQAVVKGPIEVHWKRIAANRAGRPLDSPGDTRSQPLRSIQGWNMQKLIAMGRVPG